MRTFMMAAVLALATTAGSTAAAPPSTEQACRTIGGSWDATKRACVLPNQAAARGGADNGAPPPQPVEGTTITGCVPLGASGDPLKGLNISKPGGGSNPAGGTLCP